jgi:glucans biosynthesis protein
MTLDRRAFLNGLQGLAGFVAALKLGGLEASAADVPMFGPSLPFGDDFVLNLARERAKKDFVEEKIDLPQNWQNLSYDQYRDIRFNPDKSFWRGAPHGFSFDLFHSGFYYTSPVDIHVVAGNEQRRINYVPDLFTFGPLVPRPSGETDLHYAGFRLRYPINSTVYFDEFAVFQGASYFRAIGRNLLYGLSARGLAINTGQPKGEEFPFFRAFWLKTPADSATAVVVDALLDSQSCTGAYRFTIKPGEDTQMDIEATLFPRRDIDHVGLAPLTSMFFFDPLNRRIIEDYRRAVHDSDGLMMLTGAGEWLWRPVNNPQKLEISVFADNNPRGFGLMQRKRRYEDYLDLEAKYERRPSLWVDFIGDWGAGAIELYEIPTDLEINDNIVAFWQPKEKLTAGGSPRFVYRLHWCKEWPPAGETPKALVSFSGGGLNYNRTQRLYVIEFAGGNLTGELVPDVSASAGAVSNIVVQPNPETGATRLSFELDTKDIDMSELRAVLKRGTEQVSETWLSRWTRT